MSVWCVLKQKQWNEQYVKGHVRAFMVVSVLYALVCYEVGACMCVLP